MTFQQTYARCKKAEGWLSEREARVIYDAARACTGRGVIVEIGSWQGRSTIVLGDASRAGKRVKIHAIDPHVNSYVHEDFLGKDISTFEIFQNNIRLAGIDDLVEPIVKKSEDAVVGWNKPIEFLWIDGDHRYSEVKKDFDLWSPFVVEGGTVAFHDATYDDVKRFTFEAVLKNKKFRNVRLGDSVLAVTKTSGRSPFDAARSWYIGWFVELIDALRRVPMPSGLRSRLKGAVKSIIHRAQ